MEYLSYWISFLEILKKDAKNIKLIDEWRIVKSFWFNLIICLFYTFFNNLLPPTSYHTTTVNMIHIILAGEFVSSIFGLCLVFDSHRSIWTAMTTATKSLRADALQPVGSKVNYIQEFHEIIMWRTINAIFRYDILKKKTNF